MKQKIITEIKTVEDEASAILTNASVEVKRIQTEALREAAEMVLEKNANAKANATIIKIEAVEKASALTREKSAETDRECMEIQKKASEKFDRAAQYVFERIISADGDR